MTLIIIFVISGLVIVLMIAVKGLEEGRNQPFLISRAISKGDIYTRASYHKSVSLYFEGKQLTQIFFTKKVPKHSKNLLNKLLLFLKTKREQYAESMRDSKLLKKSDGLSEFFKNMSTVEKGNGEVHDIYEKASPNNDPVGRGSQEEQKEVK